jgi:hypothetical protein
MAARELADDHCWSGPNNWGDYRCQAAPIRKLGIEQRVVFVELFAEPVGNYFETRAQPSRVELNARVVTENAIAFVPPCRVGIAHDLADTFVEQERLDGPKEWENQLEAHGWNLIATEAQRVAELP